MGSGGGAGGGAPESLVEDYLRSDDYGALVLEIDSVPGHAPRPGAVDALVATIESLVDKPDGVTATLDGELASLGADHAYTHGDLAAMEEASRDLVVPPGTVKIHVLFVDGHADSDTSSSKVLGRAYGNEWIVMFEATIEDGCASSSIGDLFREELCERAQEIVWTHEMGHVFGLVDNGAPMLVDHRDDAHGAHDDDEECLMYWAVDSEAALDLLAARIVPGATDPLPTFDQECLDDLAAIRDAP